MALFVPLAQGLLRPPSCPSLHERVAGSRPPIQSQEGDYCKSSRLALLCVPAFLALRHASKRQAGNFVGARRTQSRGRTCSLTARQAALEKFIKVRSNYPDEKPVQGDLVRIHYVGRLPDGRVFDSSRVRGKPFEYVLGETEVIDGWDMLISTMALGERANLVIPADFAYGVDGAPPVVPPNATLTFDMELVDIGKPIEEEKPEEVQEEEEEEEEPTPFWEEMDPDKEAGRGSGYAWEATGSSQEIRVDLRLKKDVKVRDIKVDVKTNSITATIAGEKVLQGDLFAGVDSDDSHWDLEKVGKNSIDLKIYLCKLDRTKKWESLFKGGDTKPPVEAEVVEAEVVDVDAALRAANAQSRP